MGGAKTMTPRHFFYYTFSGKSETTTGREGRLSRDGRILQFLFRDVTKVEELYILKVVLILILVLRRPYPYRK